ncbi:alkane hydroxylase MAH1-like [Mangifera indica]|uniref:alkane hydroxylase MAH1-like n=1 Tax=Mangifera indica TaxID=29780 RepID=UPI001CFB108B|nr:alkane hydroxylase MAH1-like [Mangifera indica]
MVARQEGPHQKLACNRNGAGASSKRKVDARIRHRQTEASRWTYNFKGPWFADMDLVVTSDPMNIHHICSRNFANYPKGREYKEIFKPLGEGIFNANGEMWKIQRKMLHSLFKNNKYESALVRTINRKVENGLFPFLIMPQRSDLGSLSVGFPPNEYEKAYNKMEEAAFYRKSCRRVVGSCKNGFKLEKRKSFRLLMKLFLKFLRDCISVKKERLSWRRKADEEEEEEEFDLLTALLEE